jgi:hypothetical protein
LGFENGNGIWGFFAGVDFLWAGAKISKRAARQVLNLLAGFRVQDQEKEGIFGLWDYNLNF